MSRRQHHSRTRHRITWGKPVTPPGYCTTAEAAKIIGITLSQFIAVHKDHIPYLLEVAGLPLGCAIFQISDVQAYARRRRRRRDGRVERHAHRYKR